MGVARITRLAPIHHDAPLAQRESISVTSRRPLVRSQRGAPFVLGRAATNEAGSGEGRDGVGPSERAVDQYALRVRKYPSAEFSDIDAPVAQWPSKLLIRARRWFDSRLVHHRQRGCIHAAACPSHCIRGTVMTKMKPARLAAASDLDAERSQPGSAGHSPFKRAAGSSSLPASSGH